MNNALMPDAKELENRRIGLKTLADGFDPKTADDVAKGEEILKEIKQAEDAISTRKTEITRPLMQSLASARDLFKPFEAGLAEAKKVVKSKILEFQAKEEEKALLEQERIAARVKKGTMKPETALNKIADMEQGKSKANTRTIVKVRIVDESKVPREWCTPDVTKITEAVLREGASIPGVERYEEKILVTKR